MPDRIIDTHTRSGYTAQGWRKWPLDPSIPMVSTDVVMLRFAIAG